MLFSLVIVAGCEARRGPRRRLLADQEKNGAFGTGSSTDTSPRFGCCLETKVAIRELPGNVETSNFSLDVARSRRLLVPIGELVDSAGRQFASTLCLFSQNQEVPNG